MQDINRIKRIFGGNKKSPEGLNLQSKDNSKQTQLQTIFHYLRDNTATASMAAEDTGIFQKNICRFKRMLQLAGLLWETERKLCKKTGHRATYLTTNQDNVLINSPQLRLF